MRGPRRPHTHPACRNLAVPLQAGAFRLPLKLADRLLAPAPGGGWAQQAACCSVLLHLPGSAEGQPLHVAAQLVERQDDEGFRRAAGLRSPCSALVLACATAAADALSSCGPVTDASPPPAAPAGTCTWPAWHPTCSTWPAPWCTRTA